MTLKEIYTKIISDENLEKAFSEAKRNGKLAEFLAENECEASLEEAEAFLISGQGKNGELADGELDDDELDDVAGGGCGQQYWRHRPLVGPDETCEYYADQQTWTRTPNGGPCSSCHYIGYDGERWLCCCPERYDN